jgi:cyclopropane-fatty-acyl-phospholipid synthase
MTSTWQISPAQKAARAALHAVLRGVHEGQVTVVDGDGEHTAGSPRDGLRTRVVVHDPAVYPALLARGKGMARTYAEGRWDCDDLVALVRIAARAMFRADPWRARLATATWPVKRVRASFRNTRRRSRDNVERHYDLGNDFFSLVLDETMGYSCAFYVRPDMDPVEASRANLDRVCTLLDLQPGERVLELGSGWGPFALHAAEHYGVQVSTVTLSHSQRDHILQRARERGVAGRVEVIVSDYRDVRGAWDKAISMEMVESIGAAHLDDFSRQIGRLIKPDGLALVQAITTTGRLFPVERYNSTFINEMIFPGGHTPSIEAILDAVSRSTDLRPVAMYDITAHYPPTLRAWRARLQQNWPRIEALGRFDEWFRRLWTLYFSWCEAAFEERRIQDRQILLAGPRWRDEDRLLGIRSAAAQAPEVRAEPVGVG